MTSQNKKSDAEYIDGKDEKAPKYKSGDPVQNLGYVFLVKEVTCDGTTQETGYFKTEEIAGSNAPNQTVLNNLDLENPRRLEFVTNSSGISYYYVSDKDAALGAANTKFNSMTAQVTGNKLGGGPNWLQKIGNTNWDAIMSAFESSISRYIKR